VTNRRPAMSGHDGTGKRAFQLERLILFSDAVFAIAITLLVIEIKVPMLHGTEATPEALGRELLLLLPRVLGFLVSFTLIGVYWTRHHFLFGYVSDYTPRLIRLNLLFLLSIVVMPFSTGIFGEYSTPRTMYLQAPVVIYALNICFTGVMLFLLWGYVGNAAHRVADESLTPEVVQDARRRAVLITSVFALAVPVAFFDAMVARYVPILLPLVFLVGKRKKRVTP
jgi:uncharacterized membrane protein